MLRWPHSARLQDLMQYAMTMDCFYSVQKAASALTLPDIHRLFEDFIDRPPAIDLKIGWPVSPVVVHVWVLLCSHSCTQQSIVLTHSITHLSSTVAELVHTEHEKLSPTSAQAMHHIMFGVRQDTLLNQPGSSDPCCFAATAAPTCCLQQVPCPGSAHLV